VSSLGASRGEATGELEGEVDDVEEAPSGCGDGMVAVAVRIVLRWGSVRDVD
jgi:hypothetical protein